MKGRGIREVTREDIPSVIAIEKASFPRPWDDDIFRILGSWRGRVQTQARKIVYMYVIESNDELAGYVIWQEDKEISEGHLLNIAVRPLSRRQGLGQKLLEFALDTMRSHNLVSCRLEVRETNAAAQALYAQAGMSIDCVDSGYYEGEDALIYTLKL